MKNITSKGVLSTAGLRKKPYIYTNKFIARYATFEAIGDI